MTTVREHLRLAALHPESRRPFEFQVPKRRVTPRRKKKHDPRRKVQAKLAVFLQDLAAGIPDERVAARSGLTTSQVKHARPRLGIKRPPGRQPNWRHRHALRGFADPERASVVHEFASPVAGRWEPPRYTLRKPMSYERFLDIVQLGKAAGRTPAEVADGIGVREQDIMLAWVLGDRL